MPYLTLAFEGEVERAGVFKLLFRRQLKIIPENILSEPTPH
jgi:hypothetical protein